MRNALLAAVVGLVLVGCTSTSITNLTPTQYSRNDTGIYPVEVELTSQQQTLLHQSISPTVIVGGNSYPMRRTLKTNYRWEGAIPISRNQTGVTYHFKFDYSYNRFGTPGRDSKLSPSYELQINNP